MSYAVVVEFRLKPSATKLFLTRVQRQAEDSLRLENGCLIFKVWTSNERPNQVYLYEVYENKSAFDDHLKSEHFTAFDREVVDWVFSKQVQAWDELVV